MSLSDLVETVKALKQEAELEISEKDCQSLFESLDADKTGFIQKAAWKEAIAGQETVKRVAHAGYLCVVAFSPDSCVQCFP